MIAAVITIPHIGIVAGSPSNWAFNAAPNAVRNTPAPASVVLQLLVSGFMAMPFRFYKRDRRAAFNLTSLDHRIIPAHLVEHPTWRIAAVFKITIPGLPFPVWFFETPWGLRWPLMQMPWDVIPPTETPS